MIFPCLKIIAHDHEMPRRTRPTVTAQAYRLILKQPGVGQENLSVGVSLLEYPSLLSSELSSPGSYLAKRIIHPLVL